MRSLESFRLTICGSYPGFSPVPQGVQDWKAQISIRSRQDIAPGITGSSTPTTEASLAPYLCYACHTTLTSRSSRPGPSLFTPDRGLPSTTLIDLPTWTRSHLLGRDPSVNIENGEVLVTKQVSESDMHRAVKEFLLED